MSQLIGYLSEGEQLKGSLTIPQQLGGSTLGSKTITANGVYDATDDGLNGYDVVTANVPNTYAAGDEGKVVDNGALVSQTTATYTANNTYDTTKIKSVTVNVGGGSPTLENITKTYTPTTSQQTEQITPSSGYDGIAEVDVTVNAMPTGTEGTPTATKGAVSNHSVSVTPSVTNTTGYITGSTKTGTAVTVSASELVSGTKSITANGTGIDVAEYEYIDAAVPNSYSAGDEGKVVSNGALVSQTSDTVTANDTYDTTLINSLTVNVSGGGGSDDFPKFLNNTLTELIDDNGDITSIVAYGCYGRSSLTNVRLSGCTSIGGYSFYNCSGLKSIVLPSHTGDFLSRIFQGCSSLEAIDTGGGRIAFSGAANVPWLNCANFDTLIVRKTDSIMPLSPASGTSSTFNGTPFANGTGGTLYVPSALINSYKTGTNWTTWFSDNNTYGNQVLAIEGSYYQTHYADGSTIPT